MLIPSLETTTAAYFAGLFDGEGWIRIETYKGKRGGWATLTIGLGSTDLSIAPKMKELFGGHVSRVRIPGKSSRKLMQQWGCTNDTAADFLRVVFPYLIIKKRQAALAFKFRKIMSQTRWKHNTHRYDLLLKLAMEIRSLNHGNGEVPGVETVKTDPLLPLFAGMSQSKDPEPSGS